MIKIAVTLAKYVPQVLLNRERRSTSGFSIAQVPRAPCLVLGCPAARVPASCGASCMGGSFLLVR